MREISFIRRNLEKWRRAEDVAGDPSWHSPDELADVYIDVTADLSFAQTHYPQSRVTLYLNNLAVALHNELYKNKREKWSRVVTFWTREVPLALWDARRLLLVSFVIMAVSTLMGSVSQAADPDFCRVILDDSYVDMTLENIRKGTPMAVYDDGGETRMFLGILLNNVMVAFRTYALGLLTSFGTALSLFYNSIMLGSFLAFFSQYGLLGEAMLTVMLHGTLEMSAILIAGAAGLAMGNGWLFPGRLSRLASFRKGAKRGLKIVVGTVPMFVVAAFIEGFVTRHTGLPDALRLSVVVLSAAFVLYYIVWLPRKRHRQQLNTNHHA